MDDAFQNLAFYRFVEIDDPEATREWLERICEEAQMRGTLIVASEGLNGMLAGTPAGCEEFERALRSDERFKDLWIKRSSSSDMPFGRLDVKVKPEIVTMRTGYMGADETGEHLAPETFRNWLRSGEDMVVIDTRNDFEFRMGTFRGALNPETTAFHEFPAYVREHADELASKKVVMFCTGGIRCEKATSWMKSEGLDAYQLEGGVLNYFEKIEDAHEDWEGELFVFDRRVGVNTRLEETDARLCPECGRPFSGEIGALCDDEHDRFVVRNLITGFKGCPRGRRRYAHRLEECDLARLGRPAQGHHRALYLEPTRTSRDWWSLQSKEPDTISRAGS